MLASRYPDRRPMRLRFQCRCPCDLAGIANRVFVCRCIPVNRLPLRSIRTRTAQKNGDMLRIQWMAQASAVDAPEMIKMHLDLALSVCGRIAWKGLAVDRAVLRQHSRPGHSRCKLGRFTCTILVADLELRLKLVQQ